MRLNKLTEWLARCAVLVCLAVPFPGTAADEGFALRPYSAEYKVKVSLLSGILSTRLDKSGTGYIATHRIDPQGMAKLLANGYIEESADFRIDDGTVVAQHYVSTNTIESDQPRASLAFDQGSRMVSGTVDGNPVEETAESEFHDRISIQYELMLDLIKGETGKTYLMFDDDEFKTLTITNIGSKEIDVPAGKFTAIGIQHQAVGSSRITTLWCVAELDFLPAIIEQHRKDKLKMRALLIRYTPEENFARLSPAEK